VTKPGTTTATPAITPDIPATILDLTGVGTEPAQPLDGVSLASVLRGESLDREALYWHYPHYHPGGATPYSAIRAGDWRLVHFSEDGRNELYDLAHDPGEATDLAAKEPARVAELKATLDAWLAAVDAQFPTLNPNYDPARDKPAGRSPKKAARSRSPNVLFIIADDASCHFGEAYGCRWAQTPAIDRLAAPLASW
jgi:arylsulfatase A